jgi:hypothetical protein
MIANTDVTQVGMLIGAVGALSTVIGVLWKQMISHFKQVEAKLKDCEDDRQHLWEVLADQAQRPVEEIRGKR